MPWALDIRRLPEEARAALTEMVHAGMRQHGVLGTAIALYRKGD